MWESVVVLSVGQKHTFLIVILNKYFFEHYNLYTASIKTIYNVEKKTPKTKKLGGFLVGGSLNSKFQFTIHKKD